MKPEHDPPFLISAALVPWVVLATVLGLRMGLGIHEFRDHIMGELGPVELGTVALLLIAIWVGVGLLRAEAPGLLRLWHLAVVLGCVYFAGEELSWGQHLVGWTTPDSLARLNDQGETNLHNISSWLDQKPRLALELWIAFGVIHAGLAWKRRGAGAALEPGLLPGLACLSAGLAVVISRLPERLAGVFHWAASGPFDIRLSEVQELLIALHLLTYLAAAARQQPRHPPPI